MTNKTNKSDAGVTNKSDVGVWYALSLAWQLGYTIAIPIVVLALTGRFLDKKFDTSPWLLLAGIALSLIISTLLIYKKVMKVIDQQ